MTRRRGVAGLLRRIGRISRDPLASCRRWAHRAEEGHLLPVGGVARDRRLLRAALGRRLTGRTLVVGPVVALRQAMGGLQCDVAGTSPYDPHVTVVSLSLGEGALPAGRWQTVVLSELSPRDAADRLAAAVPAVRPGGELIVLMDRDDTPLPPLDSERRLRVERRLSLGGRLAVVARRVDGQGALA